MADCTIRNWQGEEVGKTDLSLNVADSENAAHIVHRALVRQMANARQGTASTKTRSEVRGGGRKPWRQKGTGRARAGSTRSPLWKGGGVIFGPKPRDYGTKMNRKERRLALRTAFQSRVEDMIVVEDFTQNLKRPRTKDLVEAIGRWGVESASKVLLIVNQRDENLELSARNVPTIKLITASNLNIYDVLAADYVLVTASALDSIKEVYSA